MLVAATGDSQHRREHPARLCYARQRDSDPPQCAQVSGPVAEMVSTPHQARSCPRADSPGVGDATDQGQCSGCVAVYGASEVSVIERLITADELDEGRADGLAAAHCDEGLVTLTAFAMSNHNTPFARALSGFVADARPESPQSA